MAAATFTCPRCFQVNAVRRGSKFCRHCGLADAQEAAADKSPLDITIGRITYHVLDLLEVGSISSVYRCRFMDGAKEVEGVFKIARDPRTNSLICNEANVLRQLHAVDPAGKHTPFLPGIAASFAYGGEPGSPPRQGNVLRMHDEIQSPDELYTLWEVKKQFPDGVDPKHVAWIWRRILTIIGFAHSNGIVHGAVLPMHVLIEPAQHKLLLIDWCCATQNAQPLTVIAGGHRDWYKRERASTNPPTPALDVAFGARCMIELLGGNPVSAEFPKSRDPALVRHFQRCLAGGSRVDAWKLLADFDKLIEALWGPKRFQVLEMPSKARLGIA
jgi:hypothetical protein